MVRYALFTVAGLAVALPLNINLGAYSPALVVGDGEISFGGNQDVSNLMNVLEGAAVNAAAGAAAAPATNAAAAPVVAAPAAPVAEAPVVAAAAAADPALQEQAQQITALQGMGKKEIAPREDDTKVVTKRDINGFDRALRFAEAALVKGPKVQLGTGKEGSGVGIIVDNNQEAAARAGTGRAEGAVVAQPGAEKKKRADLPGPKAVRTKVTTMYVRSGIPASLQARSDGVQGRSVPAPVVPVAARAAPAVSSRDAIDAVNLNVDGDQGITMTFVETVTDEDD